MTLPLLKAVKEFFGASRSSTTMPTQPVPVGSTYASSEPPEKEAVFVKKTTFVVSSTGQSLSEQMAKYIWD